MERIIGFVLHHKASQVLSQCMLGKLIGLIFFVLCCSFLQISGIEAGVMYVNFLLTLW